MSLVVIGLRVVSILLILIVIVIGLFCSDVIR